MSETQSTEAPSEIGPQGSSVSAEPDDATKPLQPDGSEPKLGAGSSGRGGTEAAPENGGDEAKPDAEEERKRAERRREAQRIGYLTKQRYAEKARADAAEARLRELQTQAGTGGQQPSPQEVEQWIDQRAAQKLAIEKHNERFSAWDAKGAEEFGEQKFRDACKTVADMASEEQRRMLVDVALDTDGGHRAILELADNPEEAERILALPPHKMALALAKLGAPPAPPAAKPVSNAPPPIRPPAAGRARGEPDPERGSYGDYKRWSGTQNWRR